MQRLPSLGRDEVIESSLNTEDERLSKWHLLVDLFLMRDCFRLALFFTFLKERTNLKDPRPSDMASCTSPRKPVLCNIALIAAPNSTSIVGSNKKWAYRRTKIFIKVYV